MHRSIGATIVLALALIAGGSNGASAWGWSDHCDGPYCYGPPYGNVEPPPIYAYDHRTGPTWTGNGWVYLPVGAYYPGPPEYAPPPPPYGVNIDHESNAHPRQGDQPLK